MSFSRGSKPAKPCYPHDKEALRLTALSLNMKTCNECNFKNQTHEDICPSHIDDYAKLVGMAVVILTMTCIAAVAIFWGLR